jgi:microcystin-dependent protein
MDDVFVGEIRAVGFGFAPYGWALCDGSLLQISRNTALFALLGTTYGGDGRTTFALPDMRGRILVNPGQGPGLSSYVQGQRSGTETVTLAANQLPLHTHGLSSDIAVAANNATGTSNTPAGNVPALNTSAQQYSSSSDAQMSTTSVTGTATAAGGTQAHSNLMPYLPLYYVIALQGEFPQRS